MIVEELGCCAIREIKGLSSYASAKAAMLAFCNFNKLYTPVGETPKLRNPGSFILFTGVINIQEGSTDYLVQSRHTNVVYGPKFAKLITDKNLGELVTLPSRQNMNHKTHLVQPWMWLPDHKALSEWYEKNRPKPRKKKA